MFPTLVLCKELLYCLCRQISTTKQYGMTVLIQKLGTCYFWVTQGVPSSLNIRDHGWSVVISEMCKYFCLGCNFTPPHYNISIIVDVLDELSFQVQFQGYEFTFVPGQIYFRISKSVSIPCKSRALLLQQHRIIPCQTVHLYRFSCMIIHRSKQLFYGLDLIRFVPLKYVPPFQTRDDLGIKGISESSTGKCDLLTDTLTENGISHCLFSMETSSR